MICSYCQSLFTPKRAHQQFCGDKCRTAYHIDHGTQARVVSVRKLVDGCSVILHLKGASSEAALGLDIGVSVRVIR